MLQQNPILELIKQNNVSDVLSDAENYELEEIFDEYLTDRVSEFDTCSSIDWLLEDFLYMIKSWKLIKSPLWRERRDMSKYLISINGILSETKSDLEELKITLWLLVVGTTKKEKIPTASDTTKKLNDSLALFLNDYDRTLTLYFSKNFSKTLINPNFSIKEFEKILDTLASFTDSTKKFYLLLELKPYVKFYGRNTLFWKRRKLEFNWIIPFLPDKVKQMVFLYWIANLDSDFIVLWKGMDEIFLYESLDFFLTRNWMASEKIFTSGIYDFCDSEMQKIFLEYITLNNIWYDIPYEVLELLPNDFVLEILKILLSKWIWNYYDYRFSGFFDDNSFTYTQKLELCKTVIWSMKWNWEWYAVFIEDAGLSTRDSKALLDTILLFRASHEKEFSKTIENKIQYLTNRYWVESISYNSWSILLWYSKCDDLRFVLEFLNSLDRKLYYFPPPLLKWKKIIIASETDWRWWYSWMSPNKNTIILNINSIHVFEHELFDAWDWSDWIFSDDYRISQTIPDKLVKEMHTSLVWKENEAQADISESLFDWKWHYYEILSLFQLVWSRSLPSPEFVDWKFILSSSIKNHVF